MYPRLGGLENPDGILLYNPILAVAVLTMNVLIFWIVSRMGIRPCRMIAIQLAVSVGGFGGAKIYSFLFRGRIGSFVQELEGGWRYPGALIGMIVAVLIARRLLPRGLSPMGYLDAWAPGLAIGCAIGRIGCLLHGCCYGAISAVPWAIRYPYASIPWYAHRDSARLASGIDELLSAAVHPFPIYLLLMEVALGLHLLRLHRYARFEGEVVLRFLAIHGLAKGALEFFRDPFSWMHFGVVPVGVIAVLLLLRSERWSWKRDSCVASSPAATA